MRGNHSRGIWDGGGHQYPVKTPFYGATRTCMCLLSDTEKLSLNGTVGLPFAMVFTQ
jgi:hypothetical protein